MKTLSLRKEDAQHDWYVVDASNKILGRLATKIADRIRGKDKPTFTPHTDGGDYVVVINAEKIQVTGKKFDDKKYYTHSLYPGGLKTKVFKDVIEDKIIKVCDYLDLKDKSFDGFINWVLDLRKKLNMPHKLSEVIDEKDFNLDRLSKMALEDPSTGGNPKKLTEADMKTMYQHSMSGNLF